jgi:triose/dihydroxyacetone kinase / FAD-AMP lyase (cyclizing)
MAGISLSLLGLTDDRLRWLDAATTAPAWPNVPPQSPQSAPVEVPEVESLAHASPAGAQTERAKRVKRAIESACRALLAAEPELTELDRITGDGDLGVSMARGANALESAVDTYPLDDVAATLTAAGHTLRNSLGGSSGPLYGVLFLRCGHALAGGAQWAEALRQGSAAICQLGGAKPGDRTMLDALDPFVTTLESGQGAMAAVAAAERGAEATASMKPRLGRSSYLGDRVLGHPDPGAKALAIWLRAACESLFE